MKELNVLILGVGSNVSQGLITAVRNSKIPCRIIGACIDYDHLGLYLCDAAYISPYAIDDTFIDWVANLCNNESVDIILTGVEEIILSIEMNRTEFESKSRSIFVSSNIEKLKILKNNGFNYPLFADRNDSYALNNLINQCGFPLIAKPRNGKGSSGIFKLMSRDDLNLIQNTNYCIQQYLGDEKLEYTVACYVDKRGIQQELIIMRRELKYGTTFMAEIVDNKKIREMCMKICTAFKPKGPLNIQLRMHNGIPVCFELNVRFSGTIPIRAKFGYNDVDAMMREYLFDEEVNTLLKPFSKGRAYRYFNEFYMDTNMYKTLNKLKEVKDVNVFNNFQELKK